MEKNISKFGKDFIKSRDEDSDEGYILEAEIEYPKDLHDLDSDLPFFHETMKIDKCHKLVCNLYDKSNCVVHISFLKQTLDHGLILKKVHKVIQFDQKATLKEIIDINTEFRKQAKSDFEKNFFKLMNDSAFGKTIENVRKYREIRLVTTKQKKKSFSIRTKLPYNKNVFRGFTSNRNEENKNKKE